MKLENLAPEQVEKAKACTTPEELLALAREEGMELSDEELQVVSGGTWHGAIEHCTHHSCETYDCAAYGCGTVSCFSLDCMIF